MVKIVAQGSDEDAEFFDLSEITVFSFNLYVGTVSYRESMEPVVVNHVAVILPYCQCKSNEGVEINSITS